MMKNRYHCGHCGYEGPCYTNGFSAPWCNRCQRNSKLVRLAPPPSLVNGNEHLANMEVHEYDGLKFVTESPQPGAIRLTIYRGEETTPMSTEVYGNESS
jgi:hypothetical protein